MPTTRRPSLLGRLPSGLGLPVVLGIPLGLGFWLLSGKHFATPTQAVLGATGCAALGSAYFVLEAAADVADEAANEDRPPVHLFSFRVRPEVLLAFFIVVLFGLALLAGAFVLTSAAA